MKFNLKSAAIATGLILSIAGAPSHSWATTVLDQANEQGFGNLQYNGGSSTFAWQQGITAGVSGTLTSVDLYFWNPGEINFTLSSSAPWNATPQYTQRISVTSGWNSIDVSGANLGVQAGNQFSVGLQGVGAGSDFDPAFGGTHLYDSYLGGALYANGSVFVPQDHYDMGFRTYVDATQIPLFSTRYSSTALTQYGQNSSYNLSFDGSKFTVEMLIGLTGDAVNASVIQEWESGIEDIWSNQFNIVTAFGTSSLIFDVSFVDENSQFDALVSVVDGSCRSSSLSWCVDPQIDQSGNPRLDMRDEVAAHEFGHLIGNFDEYFGGFNPLANSSQICTPNFVPFTQILINFTGEYCRSMMADLGGVKERYFSTLLDQIGQNIGLRPVLGNSPFLNSYNFTPVGNDFKGLVESSVPEPAIWLEMIFGFFLAGSAIRRRHLSFDGTNNFR